MWRGGTFHTLFVVLIAVQVLFPLHWVKQSLDCFQHCRLAATTGAHCPLLRGAQPVTSSPHCHEPAASPSVPEWRCNCSQSSPSLSTLDMVHFIVPHGVTVVASVFVLPQFSHPAVVLIETCLAPPDPPPRPSFLILL